MIRFALVAALCAAVGTVRGQDKGQDAKGAEPPAKAPGAAGAQLAGLAQKASRSLVRVEFTARYDKGESPGAGPAAGIRRFLPPALRTAMNEGWEGWDDLIGEERPAERAGVLVAPRRVVVADPMLHPRFLKSIAVRFGDKVVNGAPAAYPKDRRYLILDLDGPLEGAEPVAFGGKTGGPLYAVTYGRDNGIWSISVAAMPTDTVVNSDGRSGTACHPEALVVDSAGAGVGLTGLDLLPLDHSWAGSPERWPAVGRDEMDTMLATLARDTDRSMVRVALALRSPRAQGDMGRFAQRFNRAGEDGAPITEWNGTGLLVDPSTVLVLASLRPKVTARLDRITIHLPDGTSRSATFSASLKDWGGFVATLDQPLEGHARLSTVPLLDQRDRLLLRGMFTVRGEAREAHYWRERVTEFATGWGGQVYPVPDSLDAGWNPWGPVSPTVNAIYALDGSLVAVQMTRRPKVTAEDGPEEKVMVPAALLADLLRPGDAHVDRENRPLSEEEENRLAWLGVELQPMDPELARASKVADQTEGGRTGGLVTYVYPDSPGERGGLKEGDILLRLHVQGQPKPLDIVAGGPEMGGMGDDFWQYLDQMPEEYFDQMPKPWGSAETPLTRALTDVGFGTPFAADVFRDGKVLRTDFTVAEGPPHYDAARRFKSEDLGVTVRDLTYEVRRYFRIKPGDPGVIISKIEKGEKAAVAGLKPYEIITSINDRPVASAQEAQGLIEEALAAGGELRLAVKRMTKGRIVKIRLGEPAAADKNADGG